MRNLIARWASWKASHTPKPPNAVLWHLSALDKTNIQYPHDGCRFASFSNFSVIPGISRRWSGSILPQQVPTHFPESSEKTPMSTIHALAFFLMWCTEQHRETYKHRKIDVWTPETDAPASGNTQNRKMNTRIHQAWESNDRKPNNMDKDLGTYPLTSVLNWYVDQHDWEIIIGSNQMSFRSWYISQPKRFAIWISPATDFWIIIIASHKSIDLNNLQLDLSEFEPDLSSNSKPANSDQGYSSMGISYQQHHGRVSRLFVVSLMFSKFPSGFVH